VLRWRGRSRGFLATLVVVAASGCAVDVARVGGGWGDGPAPTDRDRPVTVDEGVEGRLAVGLPILVDAPEGGEAPDPAPIPDTTAAIAAIRSQWVADSARTLRVVDSVATTRVADSLRTLRVLDSLRPLVRRDPARFRGVVDSVRHIWSVDSAGTSQTLTSVRRARATDSLRATRAIEAVVTSAVASMADVRAMWNVNRCTVWSAWANPDLVLPPPDAGNPIGLEFVSGDVPLQLFPSGERRSARPLLQTPTVSDTLRNEVGELQARLVVRLWMEPGAAPPGPCLVPDPSQRSSSSNWYILDFGTVRPVEGTGMGVGAWVIGVVALTGLLSLIVG